MGGKSFAPFSDGRGFLTIDSTMKIESTLEAMTLDGNLDVTKDKKGLVKVQQLDQIMSAVVRELKSRFPGGQGLVAESDVKFPFFADDSSALAGAGLNFENQGNVVALWGSVELRASQDSLHNASFIQAHVSALAKTMGGMSLPDALLEADLAPKATSTVNNPFA